MANEARASGPLPGVLRRGDAPHPDDPAISVVVVTCGRPSQCAALVRSLTDQAGQDDELIVVDDTSQAEYAFPTSLRRVRVVRAGGQGAAGARNAAISVATRPWILFVDDDVSLEPHFLARLRHRLSAGEFDVLTANVLSHNTAAGRLFDERYPLSRGSRSVTYRGGTGTSRSPDDVWRVGVGACMAWRADAIRAVGGFPASLGQGRPFGGAEDMAAFRRALLSGMVLRYDGALVVRHRSPTTRLALRRKMREYAAAEGAFAAHVLLEERRFGMTRHLLVDVSDCPARVASELLRRLRGRPHLPVGAILAFPLDAARGFFGYVRLRTGAAPG